MWRAFWALVVVVVVADARPCTPADGWAACEQVGICRFLYRHDRLSGVQRAFDYYKSHEWLLPSIPMGWQPFTPTGPECPSSSNSSTTTISTNDPLPPSLQSLLFALQSFTHFAEGTAGCPPPQIPQCDDETGQCECFCPSATGALSAVSDGNTFCVTTDACQNALTNWAIGLGIAGLAIAFIGIVLAAATSLRALNAWRIQDS